jgi:hypothetical protein
VATSQELRDIAAYLERRRLELTVSSHSSFTIAESSEKFSRFPLRPRDPLSTQRSDFRIEALKRTVLPLALPVPVTVTVPVHPGGESHVRLSSH